MKNVVYYSLLTILWAIIHILISVLLIVFGVVEASAPNALITAVLIPEVWLLSVGLAMSTRRALAKRILHKEREYSKIIPTVMTVLGGVMVVANIALTAIQENRKKETTYIHTTETTGNSSTATNENEENCSDLLLAKTILDFRSGLNDEFEKISRKTPIILDDMTSLDKIEISASTYTFIYQLKINKYDFVNSSLEDIIGDFVEEEKIKQYYDVISLCALAGVDANDFLKTANIKFRYTFTDINNHHIGTCEFEYKDLTK